MFELPQPLFGEKLVGVLLSRCDQDSDSLHGPCELDIATVKTIYGKERESYFRFGFNLIPGDVRINSMFVRHVDENDAAIRVEIARRNIPALLSIEHQFSTRFSTDRIAVETDGEFFGELHPRFPHTVVRSVVTRATSSLLLSV